MLAEKSLTRHFQQYLTNSLYSGIKIKLNNWLLPYPGLRLEFLAAAAAAAAEPQPQVFYENFHFQNLSKKKSQSKEKLEKKNKNILKLESKKMGLFQMYEKS